ncbi:MAG: transporter [Cyclobacteriaceae bacterium]|nr:transporter [Cyclobacteriaceae bacterium]
MKHSLSVIFFFFSAFSVFAQETSSIFTDRPNATDAAGLIDNGDFQIELGFFSDTDINNDTTIRSITQPNVSIKYGLFDWMEIRLLTNYMTHIRDEGSNEIRTSGLTPITFSPKFKILDQKGFITKLSASVLLTFPNVGEKTFQNNKINFGYRILMENTLTEKLSWSHGLGTEWDDNTNANWIYSSSFGYAITDKFAAFSELYGNFNNITNSYYWDGGISYLALKNFILDAMVGAGLNNVASDYFISFGVAWKTNFKK